MQAKELLSAAAHTAKKELQNEPLTISSIQENKFDENKPLEGKAQQISPPKKAKIESGSCFAEESHTENRDDGSPDLDVTARTISDSLLVQVSASTPVNRFSSISEFDDTIVSKTKL